MLDAIKVTKVFSKAWVVFILFAVSCEGNQSNDTCDDGMMNQDETGVDCGGSCADCTPNCQDGLQNQGETGIDCGGPCADCTPNCQDGLQNQGETGIDCGGPCAACPSGDECTSNEECRQTLYPHLQAEYGTLLDCESYQGDMVCICDNTPCRDLAGPTCNDGVKNQGETGIDCGGPCAACEPSCQDGLKNQGEIGVDCGGPCPDCGTASGWRWAHSGDGNQHDPDDWHASGMALALMHRAGLKQKLAHFNWNNHLGDNSTSMKNEHDWHVNTARQAFGYTDDSVFWNCQDNLDGTIAHLAAAINASSADNKLVLTCAGPMEVCWRGIDAADDSKEQYVVVISHSGWNDGHQDTSQMNHTWDDIVKDFDVLAHHINDQNPPAFKSSCGDWNWTGDIPGYGETLSNLLCQKTNAAGDASDAGMIYYMIKQNGAFQGTSGTSKPTMAEVKSFFGVTGQTGGDGEKFTEQNGVVEFEMEELSARGAWSMDQDVPGYSGDGFFYWGGGDIFNGPATNSVLVSSTLTVTLSISNPGKYRMTITSRRNQSGECAGAASDQCNDIFTKVNDNGWCKTLVKAAWDQWITATQLECSHGNFSAPVYNFHSGENTLLVTGRSRGVRIDKIRFAKE